MCNFTFRTVSFPHLRLYAYLRSASVSIFFIFNRLVPDLKTRKPKKKLDICIDILILFFKE